MHVIFRTLSSVILEIEAVLRSACADGVVDGVPYELTYPKVKSVLGPKGKQIDHKREGPLDQPLI